MGLAANDSNGAVRLGDKFGAGQVLNLRCWREWRAQMENARKQKQASVLRRKVSAKDKAVGKIGAHPHMRKCW